MAQKYSSRVGPLECFFANYRCHCFHVAGVAEFTGSRADGGGKFYIIICDTICEMTFYGRQHSITGLSRIPRAEGFEGTKFDVQTIAVEDD